VCRFDIGRKRLEESGSETRRKLTELENQNGLLHSSLQSITSTSMGIILI
jgi:hypothetical protein